MVNSRIERASYITDLRAKIARLDANLQILERRARHVTADTRQYLDYAEQFDRLRQRSGALSATAASGVDDASTSSLEWAELRTRLDREWRELITELDGVENRFGTKTRE
jgi:hypothetical protein